MTHAPFGDVELMLRGYLTPRGLVVSTIPSDLKTKLATQKVIRANRSGGLANAEGTTDGPRVSIIVFSLRSSAAPRAAFDVARQIEADLLNLPALTAAGRLDSMRVESGPTEFPWPDPEVQAVQIICRLSTRR